jgi:hypothetical protein
MLEAMEVDGVRNMAFASNLMADRLGRCLQRLGLERTARDVTPDLRSYLAAKDGPAPTVTADE